PAAAEKIRSSEYLSICSGLKTSQAQIASGRQSSDPRCDIPAKTKPPLPYASIGADLGRCGASEGMGIAIFLPACPASLLACPVSLLACPARQPGWCRRPDRSGSEPQ